MLDPVYMFYPALFYPALFYPVYLVYMLDPVYMFYLVYMFFSCSTRPKRL